MICSAIDINGFSHELALEISKEQGAKKNLVQFFRWLKSVAGTAI